MKNNLRSPLAKAKALGSAGSGTATWWAQRVSAVALVPLVIWFALFMLKAIEYRDIELITTMFGSPFVTLFLAFFVAIGLYHGNLGMIEIIEDYVHCHSMKMGLIILIRFLSFVTAIAGICAIFVIHLSTFNFN